MFSGVLPSGVLGVHSLHASLNDPLEQFAPLIGELWPELSGVIQRTCELVAFGHHMTGSLGRHELSVTL